MCLLSDQQVRTWKLEAALFSPLCNVLYVFFLKLKKKRRRFIFYYCCWLAVRWLTGLKGVLQRLFLLDFDITCGDAASQLPAFKMFLTQRGNSHRGETLAPYWLWRGLHQLWRTTCLLACFVVIFHLFTFLICSLTGAARLCSGLSHPFMRC